MDYRFPVGGDTLQLEGWYTNMGFRGHSSMRARTTCATKNKPILLLCADGVSRPKGSIRIQSQGSVFIPFPAPIMFEIWVKIIC